jgi:LysR family transcriptional regulator, glycine cleavage system transcriptional activator
MRCAGSRRRPDWGARTPPRKRCEVTHGAISRQIGKLEDYLGLKLFSGTKRTPELTPEGKRLLAAQTPAFDQIHAAVRRVLDEKDGALEVQCYSTFAMLWLIPRLRKFHDLHPEIEVHLTTQALDKSSACASHDLTVLLVSADGDLQPNDAILMRERLGFVVSPKCLDPDLARWPRPWA